MLFSLHRSSGLRSLLVTMVVALATPAVALAAPSPLTSAQEDVSARTAMSRSYEDEKGQRVTRIYPEAVNYRSGDRWQAIDNTLVDAEQAGYVHRRANDGDALIPRDLSEPFKVTQGDSWVTFAIQDATGKARLSGAEASYLDVAPGVDASYTATHSGVKEVLTLASAAARSTFVYDVRASAGLTPRSAGDGSVEFTDSDGQLRYRFGAPVVWDAAPSSSVSHTSKLSIAAADGGGWRLTLAVDPTWLKDRARVFPVTVDPDVQWVTGGTMRYHGAQRDCTLASGSQASTSLCADPTLTVGRDSSRSYNVKLQFDVRRVIPQGATIYDATLLMHASGSGTVPASNLRVRRVASDWTSAATWNSRNATTAWTTPGGDVATGATDVGAPISVGALNSWNYLPVPAELVQSWIWGDNPDYGLQVAADAGSPQQSYSFTSSEGDPNKWPALDLYWKENQGEAPFYTHDTQELPDGSALSVNVANGNLIYRATDLTVPGTAGLDLLVTRDWQAVSNYTGGSFGVGWRHSYDQTALRENRDGSLYYRDQTGYHARFAPAAAAGTFTTPMGVAGTMCKLDVAPGCTRDGVTNTHIKYKLTFTETGQRHYFFAPSGALGAIQDAAGNRVTYADAPNDGHSVSDTQGRRITFHRDSSYLVTGATDGTRNVSYGRDAADANLLTSVTGTDGRVTRYEYNDDAYLTKITDADGNQTRIEWHYVEDFASWKTKKVTRVEDPADPTNPATNPTTTYDYALSAVGYVLRVREPGHWMMRTRALDVHVHVCGAGSDWERRHLLFRDWLRRDAGDRARYLQVKHQLAVREWPSMNHYAAAKGDVIAEILARAEAWAGAGRWSTGRP